MLDMSLELDIIELYNPLYLLPIVGVVFCALLVYAFGFKSPTQPPNFSQLVEKKVTPVNVAKKKKVSTSKAQQNGSVVTESKVEKSEKKQVVAQKTEKKVEVKPLTNKKVNNNGPKRSKKNAKNEEQSLENQDMEDKDAGVWVELISRKERKNRKQKEEKLLKESNDASLDTNPNIGQTHTKQNTKKSAKKGKENKDKNVVTISNELKASENTKSNLLIAEEKVKIEVNHEDMIAEDPDIYELVKEQRIPKKSQKNNRLNKRNAELEASSKLEVNNENDVVVTTDKLTASIIANYEAVDQNKPDSLSSANNKKKKDKNKKKPSLANQSQANKSGIKNELAISAGIVETPTDKSLITINNIPTDVKESDDDFKMATSRKRRARRE